jgi:hypothetical protein
MEPEEFEVHEEKNEQKITEKKPVLKQDTELLEIFWGFLDSELLNSVLSGYFLKIFTVLHTAEPRKLY